MEFIMALHMREQLIAAVKAHAQGEIARYHDQVEVIDHYFKS